MDQPLTHFNAAGRAHMVPVGDKGLTKREAVATGRIEMNQATIDHIKKGGMKKGDVLGVAQIAGIMGAKKTSELIPMCHPLFLEGINLTFEIQASAIVIEATVSLTGKTGVEMEALTAVSIAALTIYDMCKSMDKTMTLTDIQLIKKTGGKSDFMKEV